MEKSHKLAHIVAYYLSRFDKVALKNLGFKTASEAFHKVGEALQIKPNYVKFRRDDFDVVHPHRKGWHKRDLSSNIVNTVNALGELDERTLRSIVQDILSGGTVSWSIDAQERLVSFFTGEKTGKKAEVYIPRGITGKRAEEYFIKWYAEHPDYFLPHSELKDVRECGCGYDFEITGLNNTRCVVEVKGITTDAGGILFTEKEWKVAGELGQNFNLFVVNVKEEGEGREMIINNPFQVLQPVKNIQTVIQVNWAVPGKQLKANR